MTSLEAAKRWVYGLLDAALAIEVYDSIAPLNAPEPACVYQVLGGADDHVQVGRVIETSVLVQVAIIGRGESTGALYTQLGLVHGALDMAEATQNGFHLGAHRVELFDLPEYADGVRRNRVGATYRVLVRPSAT